MRLTWKELWRGTLFGAVELAAIGVVVVALGYWAGFPRPPRPDAAAITEQPAAVEFLPDSTRVMLDGKVVTWYPHFSQVGSLFHNYFEVGDAVIDCAGNLGYIQDNYRPGGLTPKPGFYIVSFGPSFGPGGTVVKAEYLIPVGKR